MSFVTDQVHYIDGQLDRLQLSLTSSKVSGKGEAISPDREDLHVPTSPSTPRLQKIVKALSTTSSSKIPLDCTQISSLLSQFNRLPLGVAATDRDTLYEEELQWLLVGKAAAQTYGLILKTLLEQTIPLSEDIWYWNEVLGSYRYTALYSIQTSPLRFWAWSKDIYGDTRKRFNMRRRNPRRRSALEEGPRPRQSVSQSWRRLYGMVQESVRARSIAALPATLLSPFALSRTEAKAKQINLKKLREMNASGLGVLMNECLRFDVDEDGNIATKDEDTIRPKEAGDEWKSIVEKSVTLMETVLKSVPALNVRISDFEDTVFASVDDESAIIQRSIGLEAQQITRQVLVSKRLQTILDVDLHENKSTCRRLSKIHGRPPIIVRYWLLATVLFAFSGTILGVIARRKAALTTWIFGVGETSWDFWANWVVEPLKRVVGTIRHDEGSEVALISKKSLEGDRASLERMVIDFVVDQSSTASKNALTDAEIANIRWKTKEGDLTPILKAYEHDLRRPFVGTIRGDLVRALLIQIQKTKVDIEVAIGGIDSLLKSQELVFGFIGLTPGVLVCLGLVHWVKGLFSSRKSLKRGNRQGRIIRLLRNLDRILASSSSANNDVLSYKDHGLLLCQVHELRQLAQRAMPTEIFREFLEEVHDLEDIRIGVEKQLKVVERIRWAYGKWIR